MTDPKALTYSIVIHVTRSDGFSVKAEMSDIAAKDAERPGYPLEPVITLLKLTAGDPGAQREEP